MIRDDENQKSFIPVCAGAAGTEAYMIENLLAEIESNGDRGAAVPFSRLSDIKKDFVELKNEWRFIYGRRNPGAARA